VSRNHVFAITALLIVIFLAVFAWPHPAAELEPLSVGGQTLPGRIVRYDPERVTGMDANPVHPGPRADAITVGASWDAAMLASGGEDFVEVEERRRRELRHADLAMVRGPTNPDYRHPTVERRFSGLIELRLRGEDYAIGTGRSAVDGQTGEGMVTSFVRRPQGWMVTEDLAGTQVMKVIESVKQPAQQPLAGAPAQAYDPDLVDKPWPSDSAALLAECAELFAQNHWLSRVALNRLCSPTHLPAIEAALAGPQAITAARVLLAMNVGQAFEALMRSAASIPEGERERVCAVFNTAWFDAAMLAHVRRHADAPADRLLLGAVTGALARCGTIEDLSDLSERARSGAFDAAQLEALATGLRSQQPGELHTPVLTSLVAWWGHPAVSAVALQQLGKLGGPEVMLAALVQAELSGREGQAAVLAGILERVMPPLVAQRPDTTAALLPHLAHEAAQVRWLAAEMLAACRDASARTAVARRAESEPVEPLRQRMLTLGASPEATP